MTALTLFYDGNCPLCIKEMNALTHADVDRQLRLIDIHSPECLTYPEIDRHKAQQLIHGLTANHTLLLGLDAITYAWQLQGRRRWLGVTRWPGIRWLCDAGYRLLARHRFGVSRWIMANPPCQNGRCTSNSASHLDKK